MTRVRIALASSIASLAVVSGLAGCGGDSASDTTQVEVAQGVTISVPNDVADQPPKEFLITVLNSLGDQVGFSDEWKACAAKELDAVPDARLDAIFDESGTEASTRAALNFNAQASGVCAKKVGAVIDPDATSEQIDALREITALQVSKGLMAYGQITEKEATCVADQLKALSNDQVVKFANSSNQQTLRALGEWAGACQ